MSETNDFLGFDPSQLSVFNQNDGKKEGFVNPYLYNTNPANTVSEDGYYRATIKIVYNPHDYRSSVIEQQSYGLQDERGWFSVVSKLTLNDTSCPIFKAWKTCHYAKKEENPVLWAQAAKKEEGGKALFDKRFARYVTVQVIEDKNQPDLVGKYLFWKLPATVWEIIDAKMNPSKESGKASIPVMDFLFGRSFDIEVIPGPGKPGEERYNRERSYRVEMSEDVTQVINPDGSPILNDAEQAVLDKYVSAMKKVWASKNPEERLTMINNINADENTIEFRSIYSRIREEIKSVCPNINDHMSYVEWTDEVKARVQKWIDKVLAGENPTAATTPVTTAPSNNTSNEAKSDETPANNTAATQSTAELNTTVDDDLPF